MTWHLLPGTRGASPGDRDVRAGASSLCKHWFVLIPQQLGDSRRAYLDSIGAHPLHELSGVTSRDGRGDCNNKDSLAHRMRGTIEAGAAETWSLISVQECPRPFSLRSSGESQQAVFLGPCVAQIRFCSVTPQPRSSCFSAAGIWSGWNRRSLPQRAFPFHRRGLLYQRP